MRGAQPAAAYMAAVFLGLINMDFCICYLDETGCTGALPAANSPIQPVFVLTALFVDESKLREMTTEFVRLKTKYFPAKFSQLTHHLESMRIEVKGTDLKKALRGQLSQRAKQTAERFLDEILTLLKSLDAKLVSRIWIKGVGKPFNGKSVYTVTTQHVARDFEHHLVQCASRGLVIADFRDPGSNSHVSHCIFSQKFKKSKKKKKQISTAYQSLVESPVFGISDNHAGLQIVDLLSSALICPMATYTFCTGHVNNVHVNANDQYIKQRYKNRLRALEFKHLSGKSNRYGFSVSDAHAQRDIKDLWQ